MKKKRLLFVHEQLGFLGGAEQYLFNLASALKETWELSLIYQSGTGEGEEAFHALFDHVEQRDFSAPGEEWGSPPHLVYLHKCHHFSMVQAVKNWGVPTVRMVHDHDLYCMRSYRYSPWSRKVCEKKAGGACLFPCLAPVQRDRQALLGVSWKSWKAHLDLLHLDQQLDGFFVGSQFMKKELILQGYAPHKIHVFPPIPKPLPIHVSSDFSDENVVVFAGQILRGKGLDSLLRALAQVTVPFKLVVMGRGSHEQACRDCVTALKLEDRVEFCGFLSQENMVEHYRHASCLVFPSLWPEPFGAVGLEVMRWGIPVVGYDVGGVGDWLVDGVSGYLVPWKEEKILAEKIQFLLENKEEARALGKKAQAFVEREFDYTRTLLEQQQLLHKWGES